MAEQFDVVIIGGGPGGYAAALYGAAAGLGVAMVAATAAGLYPDLPTACTAMARGGRARSPYAAHRSLYERDYQAHLLLQRHRQEIEAVIG